MDAFDSFLMVVFEWLARIIFFALIFIGIPLVIYGTWVYIKSPPEVYIQIKKDEWACSDVRDVYVYRMVGKVMMRVKENECYKYERIIN